MALERHPGSYTGVLLLALWQVLGTTNIGKQLNLAASTCRRTLGTDGSICEIVRLDGTREGLPDADFEKFIESFPIEPV
jgi:hypothetical protein